jgi:cytochrome P450
MPTPVINIEPSSFHTDPYPTLKHMRREAPICYVPELNATLFTRRDDIFQCEKMIDVFSSHQPGGLMTELMGENMMRKDGEAHRIERKQALPSLSPKTVRQVWLQQFKTNTETVLNDLQGREHCDLVSDYAMPVSAHALRNITGLLNMTVTQMDASSQAMIDGIANYAGDRAIESRCNEATALIDQCIDDAWADSGSTEHSMLHVLKQAKQPLNSIRANIKLAISGGQNEPRDAIAGAVWALLTHPKQLSAVLSGEHTWRQVFEEYARWISPIGMSPRRVAREFEWDGVEFTPESRVFFMFSSANRDEASFELADEFHVGRDTSAAISFGAGPHFCAGASASRALIADVALPMLFERFPNIRLNGDVLFSGWAFRGPLRMPIRLI